MPKKNRILLTNDDGVEAKSIWRLKKTLSAIAQCEIVAPLHPRSASSHAVTLTQKMSCRTVSKEGLGKGHAVDGTPADAMKFALNHIFKGERFDLIVSGINQGLNTGVSVFYSGTIGAAREGAISGIPSFAVSINASEWKEDHSHALELTRKIAEGYLSGVLPGDHFLNVNIPGLPADEIKGVRLTRQAPSKFVEVFDIEEDAGEYFYRLKGEIQVLGPDGTTDQEAIEEDWVSITPLNLDMTHYSHMQKTGHFIRSLQKKGTKKRISVKARR